MMSLYVGGAVAMLAGGFVLQRWVVICPDIPWSGACRIAPWRATLLAVGLPGVPLALVSAKLREPERPQSRTLPLGQFVLSEVKATLPPFSAFELIATGRRSAFLGNLVLAASLVGAAALVIRLTGDIAQWSIIAFGVYVLATWGQVQHRRDPAMFAMTLGAPTFRLIAVGGALLACFSSAVAAWAAPLAMRSFAISPMQTGLSLGLISAVASGLTVTLGGWIADLTRARDQRSPIWLSLVSLVGMCPALLVMLRAQGIEAFLVRYAFFSFIGAGWSIALTAFVQRLVGTRVRGTAASMFALANVMIGAGVGSYMAGKVSSVSGSLVTGLYAMLVLLPIASLVLLLAAQRVPKTGGLAPT